MDFLRSLAWLGFMALAGCNQNGSVCDGEYVKAGIIKSLAPSDSPEFAAFEGLQLKEVRLDKIDDSSGSTDCSARIILPTEHGPLDSHVRYRVGPAASDGHSVFMFLVMNDSLEKFFDRVVAMSRRSP